MTVHIALQWNTWVIDLVPLTWTTITMEPKSNCGASRLRKLQQSGSVLHLDLCAGWDCVVCISIHLKWTGYTVQYCCRSHLRCGCSLSSKVCLAFCAVFDTCLLEARLVLCTCARALPTLSVSSSQTLVGFKEPSRRFIIFKGPRRAAVWLSVPQLSSTAMAWLTLRQKEPVGCFPVRAFTSVVAHHDPAAGNCEASRSLSVPTAHLVWECSHQSTDSKRTASSAARARLCRPHTRLSPPPTKCKALSYDSDSGCDVLTRPSPVVLFAMARGSTGLEPHIQNDRNIEQLLRNDTDRLY